MNLDGPKECFWGVTPMVNVMLGDNRQALYANAVSSPTSAEFLLLTKTSSLSARGFQDRSRVPGSTSFADTVTPEFDNIH